MIQYICQSKYDQQTACTYAAARMWIDAIIDPIDTRKYISDAIKAANQNPTKEKFNLGLLQV